MPRTVVYPLVFVFLLLVPTLAFANQLDLFGLTGRATSLANAYTALADGPEAAFYNPGALIESRNIRAMAGYSFSVPALSLDIQTKGGGDATDPEDVQRARSPEAGQWLSAGVSGGIYDRVYFGFAMQVPIDGSARRKILSPDRPYFLDYDTGIFGLTMIPSMAVQLAPNFGLGAGVRFTMDPFGTMYSDVPTAEGDYTVKTMGKSQLNGQASPIIGFYARSHEFLRFALTYQGQSYSYYHKTTREQLVPEDPNGYVEVETEAWYNFIPRRITLGIVGEPDEHVTLTAEMSYVGWSAYNAPTPRIRLDFSNMNEHHIAYNRPHLLYREDPDFSDIFVTRFAVEPRVNKHLAFRVGYAFEPSPVPKQDGTTTIIDSSTHVISFGVGTNFGGWSGDRFSIDLAVQDHIMTDYYVTKSAGNMQEDDPKTNVAYPRFEASANYIYSGLTASFRF
ncbi:MAG: hypothetical protein GX444_09220 [Myxococcales bacterium]|nr:hypothetical protein [Myxococcales bacterium]